MGEMETLGQFGSSKPETTPTAEVPAETPVVGGQGAVEAETETVPHALDEPEGAEGLGLEDPPAPESDDEADPAVEVERERRQLARERISELVGERNDARRQVAEISAKLAKAEQMVSFLDKRYGRFKDPVGTAEWDFAYVDAADELARSKDPDVIRAAQKIRARMEERGMSEDKNTSAPESAPAADDKIGKTLLRLAEKEVVGHLADLQVMPKYRKIVGQAVTTARGFDPENVTKEFVLSATKSWMKENGFTTADIVERKADGKTPASAEEKPERRPASGGQGRAASGGNKGGKKSESQERQPAKNLDEWHERRQALFRS